MEAALIHRPQWSRVCHRCLSQSRTITTTRPQGQQVAPESPRFIAVPEPPQAPKEYVPFKKGVLPVPRDLFTHGKGPRKSSEEYLDSVTREPLPRDGLGAHGPGADRVRYDQRMADMRRRNLREGLTELHVRHKTAKSQEASAARRKHAAHKRIVNAPEREDERLTNPSVSQAIKDLLADKSGGRGRKISDKRLASSRARVEALAEKKSAIRKDQLHTLYTHARNFIVSEDQLNTELENVFGTDEDPIVWNIMKGDDQDPDILSIWNLGPPEDIDSMLAGNNKYQDVDREQLELERLRRIAGVMTGGRIPPPDFKKIIVKPKE